jgi:hypothetical protein
MNGWRWLEGATDEVGRVLLLAAAAAVLLSALAAHMPARVPGPLTAHERAAARGGRWARTLGLIGITLAALSALATLAALFPPAAPKALVLISRTRLNSPWTELPASPECAAAIDEPAVDLGEVVDGALESLAGREPHWSGEWSDNALARWLAGTIEWRELEIPIDAARLAVTSVGVDRPDLPEWFIQSVELTAVARATRAANVPVVLLAAGESTDAASLDLLADYLAQRGTLLCAFGGGGGAGPSIRPKLQRLTRARFSTEGVPALRVYALITGQLLQPARFELQLAVGGTQQPIAAAAQATLIGTVSVIAPADGYTSRILPLCISVGGCGDWTHAMAPLATFEEIARALERGDDVTLEGRGLLAPGHPSTRVVLAEAEARIEVRGPTGGSPPPELARWLKLETELHGAALSAYRRDLAAGGIARLGTRASARKAFVSVEGDAVLIAATDEGIAKARDRLIQLSTGVGSSNAPARRTRIIEAHAGGETTFSLLNVSLPGATTGQLTWPLKQALAVEASGSWPAGASNPRVAVGGIAERSRGGGVHFVILKLTRRQLLDGPDTEVITRFAIARALAWAATAVTDPDAMTPPLMVADGAGANRPAAPLLNDGELDESFHVAVRFFDVACALLVACYLLYRRQVGAAPPGRGDR